MKTNSTALLVPPPAPATVTTAPTNDIRDIKAPVPIPNIWIWVWLGILLLVLLGAAFAWLQWRKRQPRPPPVPLIPPHVRARNKLSNALALLHDPRAFCILVSDTLRLYLEERFDFHAPERTTEEFLLELQATSILNVEQKQRLAEFLEKCDLVKFAKFEPTEAELRALLHAALRLIDETQQHNLHFAKSPAPVAPSQGATELPLAPVPQNRTPVPPQPVTPTPPPLVGNRP